MSAAAFLLLLILLFGARPWAPCPRHTYRPPVPARDCPRHTYTEWCRRRVPGFYRVRGWEFMRGWA